MKVREIMVTSVRTVRPDSTVDEALVLLSRHHLTTLPVVDDGGAVVGMVGEADLIRALVTSDPRAHARPVPSAPAPRARFVSDVMSGPAYTVRPSDDVHDVAATLAEHGWKSAPVVEDEELVGVVSRSDVIAALTRPDEAVATELGEVLAEVLQEPCEVGVHHGLVTIRGVRSAEQRTIARRAAQSVVGVQVVDVEPPPMSRAGG